MAIMMHGSWDMEYSRQIFFIILGYFLSFYPTNTLKKQNYEKMEMQLEMLSFHTCAPQMTITLCMVPEIWSTTESFVIFNYFLPFYPPNNPEIQNFEKMKKKPEDIIILHMCTINKNYMMYDSSWDMKRDRQTFSHFRPFFALLPY